MAPPHPVLEPIGRGYQNKLLGNAGGAARRVPFNALWYRYHHRRPTASVDGLGCAGPR